MKYYPCIYDNRSGYIIKQVSKRPMSKEQAEAYLKRHYWHLWVWCEAIPKPVTHTGLIPSYR